MAKHLPGKVSRLISDFFTICELTRTIEHELEKRIVARHGLVKLDCLVVLLPQLKNELKSTLGQKSFKDFKQLEALIERLRKDLYKSDLSMARDSFAGHALRLDLARIVDAWKSMGETSFGVLESDLLEIDWEIHRLATAHPSVFTYPKASCAHVDPGWASMWATPCCLGDPRKPRFAVVYPGLATANIQSVIPGGPPVQDIIIRVVGISTFLMQLDILLAPVNQGSVVERLLTEMVLNDYFSLWELLFSDDIVNEYGQQERCALDTFNVEGWNVAPDLEKLKYQKHPDFERWQTVRNTCTAHVDPNVDIWMTDLQHWPMSPLELILEAGRVVETLRSCAGNDIRFRFLFSPPSEIKGVSKLSGQEGQKWSDA